MATTVFVHSAGFSNHFSVPHGELVCTLIVFVCTCLMDDYNSVTFHRFSLCCGRQICGNRGNGTRALTLSVFESFSSFLLSVQRCQCTGSLFLWQQYQKVVVDSSLKLRIRLHVQSMPSFLWAALLMLLNPILNSTENCGFDGTCKRAFMLEFSIEKT